VGIHSLQGRGNGQIRDVASMQGERSNKTWMRWRCVQTCEKARNSDQSRHASPRIHHLIAPCFQEVIFSTVPSHS